MITLLFWPVVHIMAKLPRRLAEEKNFTAPIPTIQQPEINAASNNQNSSPDGDTVLTYDLPPRTQDN
jgi:hypothetical protein